MKTTALRALLVIVFSVGCGLFFYGLIDFYGVFGSGGSMGWTPNGQILVGLGSFLMGIPVALRFTC